MFVYEAKPVCPYCDNRRNVKRQREDFYCVACNKYFLPRSKQVRLMEFIEGVKEAIDQEVIEESV